MTYATFDVDVCDRILTATFNRPQRRNSFTMAMCLELAELLDRTDADDEIRAVIITGSGPSFCAGADLEEGFVHPGQEPTDEIRAYLETVGTIDGVPRDGGGWLSLRIARSLKPVIGAFNGSAIGVGVTMTLPMDVRIAAESARFGLVFARRGLVPEAASSWFLPRIVGVSQAMEWVMTGRVFDAHDALAGGLVSAVVPDDQLLERAQEIGAEIVQNTSAVAVAASRRMLWGMLSFDSPWQAHLTDSHLIYDLAGAADCAEGVEAFLQKRPAQFRMQVSTDLPGSVPDWPARPAHL